MSWRQDRATDIRRLFYPEEGEPNLDKLVINSEGTELNTELGAIGAGPVAGQTVPGASLTEISRAIAARIWATYSRRVEGQLMSGADYRLKLNGRPAKIEYAITHKGGEVMTASLEPSLPELDWLSLVDQGTRALVMRTVYGGGGA